MKREEKNVLARQRIIEAAMHEFSKRGYEGASLNTVCAEFNISKGIIYHYYKDKDEIYLQCVNMCFETLTECLMEEAQNWQDESCIYDYFDARMQFFAQNPEYFGIFVGVAMRPPHNLIENINQIRKSFDTFTIEVLTRALQQKAIRNGYSVATIVDDFRLYLDYFNMRFHFELGKQMTDDEALKQKERCHRQLDILLYGVWGE